MIWRERIWLFFFLLPVDLDNLHLISHSFESFCSQFYIYTRRYTILILLAGILAVTLSGCKNTDNTKEETEKPVITLGSDNYPPYNYPSRIFYI